MAQLAAHRYPYWKAQFAAVSTALVPSHMRSDQVADRTAYRDALCTASGATLLRPIGATKQ